MKVVQERNLTLNHGKTISSTKSIKVLGYEVEKGLIKPDPDRLQPLDELPPPDTKKSLQRALGMFAYYAKWIKDFSKEARPLYETTNFPLNEEALAAFNRLKSLLKGASLGSIDESIPFVVECDASDDAIAATLNQ